MTLSLLGGTRKGKVFKYLIRGDAGWGLLELIPYFKQVSNGSPEYKLDESEHSGLLKITSRGSKRLYANITLEKTLVSEMNYVIIIDNGVGTTMIHKYIGSISKAEKKK